MPDMQLAKIQKNVLLLKETAKDIKGLSEEFPAVRSNIHRIMASIKMLEINTVDMIQDE